jgi:hypothetical protein
MARAPINYILDVQSPVERAMRGYQFGLGEVQAEREEDRAQQLFGMEQERFGMEQERFRTQQSAAAQAAAAQRAQAERQQAFYNDFSRVVRGELPRSELLATYPDFAETMSQTFEMIPDQLADARVGLGRRVQVAINNGRSDIADNLLSTEAEAARNSGNQAYADQLEELRSQMEANPRLVFEEIGLQLDAYGAESQQWREVSEPQAVSPIGKIAQDVEAGLIPESVLDAQIRIDERAGEEGLTLQQRIAEEARLRGEYTRRTEDLSAAERNFEIIRRSAQDNSGAGDIALVTSFMKMLDPGSVVRETEFATAANAGGLLGRLSTIFQQVESGQFLTPAQRADFQRLANDYLQAAQEQEGRVQGSYQQIVNNYGLDPVNVFGARAVTGAPAAAPTAAPPVRGGAISGGPDAQIDFSGMTVNQLSQVDVMSLTPEQVVEMMNRYNELRAQ